MKITVEVTGDNECTDSPWWAVVDPAQNMRAEVAIAAGQISGPFFSRAEAEDYLKSRHYDYSNRAVVWCFSGYHSTQWKEGMRRAIKEEDEPKKTKRYVYLPEDVRGDHIFRDRVARAGLYEKFENAHGAVFVKTEDGHDLGVKPGEFIDAGGIIG